MDETIKPVAWYRRDSPDDLAYGWGWFDSYASGGDEPLYTAAALDAAREQGRQAGLEEAAQLAHDLWIDGVDIKHLPPQIRALKDKP